ncbi:hypothetical protein [Acidiferrobacter sp.]|uniref:nitric oxide reductase activation protein NorD n=1 Tax=Acidiferrobacter sp. TaxID=1872107 RepID=UPI00262FA61A|nr:hypothetical protein [Acidiferrobacter sp.]
MADLKPLTAAELEDWLDEELDAALSLRRTSHTAATSLASLDRDQQDFARHWVGIIAKTNPELAYHFANRAAEGLRRMAEDDALAWIIQAMDVYDKMGLYPAIAALSEIEAFAALRAQRSRTVTLEEIGPVLELFLQGLSGRRLKLEAGESAFTDTTHITLPAAIALLPTRRENLRLYKALAAHLWAQTWFGTFPGDQPARLLTHCQSLPDAAYARDLFHALETIRLDACLARELPGLYRELRALQNRPPLPTSWGPWITRLEALHATVDDTYQALDALYGEPLPAPHPYQGMIDAQAVAAALKERMEQERVALQNALKTILEGQASAPDERQRVVVRKDETGRPDLAFAPDGQPLMVPPDVRALMQSIAQDLGDIPEEYLVAAGDGAYAADNAKKPEDVWKGTYHEEGAFHYNEWDFKRQHYRKEWCVLRELDVHPVHEPFVADTLRKYAGLAARLRKTFEALRGENAILRRQKQGDDIDFDALVQGFADLRTGRELPDGLFLHNRRVARNIAVMFMVDMSGSTKGWINDAERESLVLLCEALEILGDRYAIYGFSGITRKRCEIYRVKRFEDPYDDSVRSRITGIKPQDYTRMGVAIRHLCGLLSGVEARTKILLTLSDGKPDDYDGYRGEYGIEDTRQALLEARRDGIHAFCITIDTDARDYLPHMYGPANYALIDDVRKLPLKISDIYRRLTS